MVENKIALALAVVAIVGVALVGTAMAEPGNPACEGQPPVQCEAKEHMVCKQDTDTGEFLYVCIGGGPPEGVAPEPGGPCVDTDCPPDYASTPYRDENGVWHCSCVPHCPGQEPTCKSDRFAVCANGEWDCVRLECGLPPIKQCAGIGGLPTKIMECSLQTNYTWQCVNNPEYYCGGVLKPDLQEPPLQCMQVPGEPPTQWECVSDVWTCV